MSSLNIGRVLDDATGELGKSFAELCDALRLHFEATLLCHRGVPTKREYISDIR